MPPSTDQARDVALVLLNWRDEQRTITSARGAIQDDLYGQVVVLDNESTESSRAALSSALGDAVTLVAIPENRGYGGAHNVALDVIRPEIRFLMLLNTDAVIEPESVLLLRAHHERHPDCGAVGPVVYDFPAFTGTVVQTAGGDLRWRLGSIAQRQWFWDGDPDYTTFAACMLRVSALPRPAFDERQFMYWEDVDLCWRMRRNGYVTSVLPDASAWHERSVSGSTPGGGSLRLVTYSYWSARVFARKTGGRFRLMLHVRGYASWATRTLSRDRARAGAVLQGLRLPIPRGPAWMVREHLLMRTDHFNRPAPETPPRESHARRSVEAVEQFLTQAAERPLHQVIGHPLRTWSVLVALLGVPLLRAYLLGDAEGLLIGKWLTRSFPIRTPLHALTAVLEIPSAPEKYTDAPGRQTLRRKVREAERRGVTWRHVDDESERRELLCLAEAQERSRNAGSGPLPNHTELTHARLWFVAEAQDARPLLLAVVPVSRDWALLRYFWTLEASRDASAARYLMTKVIVEHLITIGVRHLADPVSPFLLPEGLRQFQSMLGFTLRRVAVRRPQRRRLRRAGLTWEK